MRESEEQKQSHAVTEILKEQRQQKKKRHYQVMLQQTEGSCLVAALQVYCQEKSVQAVVPLLITNIFFPNLIKF